jgi:predicted transcriptional regulator of viral defense system
MCVTSAARFAPFEYDGVAYRWLAPRIAVGAVAGPGGVSVTDLERTVLDSINDLAKVGGLEALLASLDAVPYLDAARLTSYLALYGKQVLYQKVGYLLSHFSQALCLPASFVAECASHVGKSVRYIDQGLPAGDRAYDHTWQLVVPRRPATRRDPGPEGWDGDQPDGVQPAPPGGGHLYLSTT